MAAARNKTRNVRHIDHEVRAACIGNLAEFLKIDRARVCTCAGNDELRFKFARLLHELIVIDAVRNGVNAVSRKIIVGAGHVDRRTVGQMAALCKVHAEHGIARLKQREIYGKVRLCAGVRLHIGMLCAEQTASTLTGDVFHNVYICTAAVIAVTRVALSIFVCEYRAHRSHNGRRHNVFGSNQLQIAALAFEFQLHRFADLGVCGFNKTDRVQKITVHTSSFPSKNNMLCGLCAAVLHKLYPIPFKMAIDDLQAHNGWRKAITYVPDS